MKDLRGFGGPGPAAARPGDAGGPAARGPAARVAPALPAVAAAVRHLSVTDAHDGQRLDNYLAAVCRNVPKSRLYRIIRSGEVRVNGGRASAERRVQAGDDVRLPPLRAADIVPAAHGAAARGAGLRVAPLAPKVVFEDDWLLVVDKPAGLAVHGGSGIAAGMIERLRAARPQAGFLELVHRIDRETSGLLMVAKRRSALTALHARLRDGQVRKRYLAIARGAWPDRWRTLEYPLHKYLTASGERRVAVQADGLAARTRVRRLAALRLDARDGLALGEFSLVEADLDTGRTHQIRVHMRQAGAPLAGDDKYGDFDLNRCLAQAGFRRMFLHAHALRVAHPADAQRVLSLQAPPPPEFVAFVEAGGGTL